MKLQALPTEQFALFNRGVRMVSANCHIHFENNCYSVPSSLVGREVTVRWNESLIRVIYEAEQVALHKLVAGTGNYVTLRSHLPDYKTYSATEYQGRFEMQFADIGEYAHAYFKNLLTAQKQYWFRTARIILGLRGEYEDKVIDASLKRALYYNAPDVVTVRNILEKKLYEIPAEPKLLDKKDTDDLLSRELTYYTTGI